MNQAEPNWSLPGVSEDDEKILGDILTKYMSEYKVWAFGSRVNGNHRPNSDLDVLIEGPNPVPLSLLGELQEQLEQSNLMFRVDLLEAARLSPAILQNIKNQKLVRLI